METELDQILKRAKERASERSATETDSATSTIEDQMLCQGLHRNRAMRHCSFDNFKVECKEQETRLGVAQSFVGMRSSQQMFLYGPPGRGKTHLAVATMRAWIQGGDKAIYWPLMQLVGKLKKIIQAKGTGFFATPDDMIDWLCTYQGLLVIDELGRTRGDTWDRDSVVYPLLDRRQGLPTIWISNFDFDDLSKIYDEAIASRLRAGKVISWPGNRIPDYRARR